MERKDFLARSLGLVAAVGVGCPCLAGSDERAAAGTVPCARGAGDYPHATSFEQRAEFAKTWAGRFMRILDERLDETTRRALMEENGRICAMGAYGPPDPSRTATLDEFVGELAGSVGPENARREGDVVYFTYRQNPQGLRTADGYCLCPLVEDGPSDLSPTFCHCSVGYVAYMFEKATGQPVNVELLESVRRGGKACRFAVSARTL